MNTHRSLILLLSSVFFTGCTKDPIETDDSDDTNTEGTNPEETDEIEETGDTEETDSPIAASTIEGSVTYIYSEDGESLCNLTTTFTGSSYSDFCFDCDQAFLITGSTITENAGTTAGCIPNEGLTLDSEAYAANDQPLYLLFWANYYDGLPRLSASTFEDEVVLYSSLFVDPIYYADDSSFSQDGNTWNWSRLTEDVDEQRLGFNMEGVCEGASDTDIDAHVSGTEHPGTTIAGSYINEDPTPEELYGNRDVWTFSAIAGDLIQVSADTTSLETWADLVVYLNGPDECTIAAGDDEASCSFAPDTFGWGCPSFEIEAPTTGTYSLDISSYRFTAEVSRQVDYSLVVLANGVDAPEMSLADDNTTAYEVVPYTLNVTGTATITEAE